MRGGRLRGTEMELIGCQPFDQDHSAGAEGAEFLWGELGVKAKGGPSSERQRASIAERVRLAKRPK